MQLQLSGLSSLKDEANILDSDGDAPIHYLAKCRGGVEDLEAAKTLVIKLLTYTNADVDLKNGSGRTALHIVAEVSTNVLTIMILLC